MATKKEAPKTEETKTEEADITMLCSEDGVHGGSWDIMETIMIPRAPKGDDQTYDININGRQFYVPKGRKVTAPHPVIERIRQIIAFEAAAAEYEEQVSKEAVEIR